jgi:ABC-type sulfate transport system substrate-binding protein
MSRVIAIIAAAAILSPGPARADEPKDILNVSYDVSRELYAEINKTFIACTKRTLASTSPSTSRMPVPQSRRVPCSKV